MCELSKEELDGYFEVKEFQSMSVIDYIKWKHGEEENRKPKQVIGEQEKRCLIGHRFCR